VAIGERLVIAPSGARKSWVEIAGSDQDRAIRVELTSPYLVRGLPFDLLPVLPKRTFQASRIEIVSSNSIFKCWTGYSAPDSPYPMASVEPHGLGVDVPPEVRLELDLHGRPHSTAAAGISRVSPILEDQRYQHFARRFLNVGGLPGRGGEENHLRA